MLLEVRVDQLAPHMNDIIEVSDLSSAVYTKLLNIK